MVATGESWMAISWWWELSRGQWLWALYVLWSS